MGSQELLCEHQSWVWNECDVYYTDQVLNTGLCLYTIATKTVTPQQRLTVRGWT
jgi:hypothetical protein